jgi:exosortase A
MAWLPVALRVLIGLLYVGLFYGVFRRLVGQWYDDPNYSHGFLVPIVSAYLIWDRRERWVDLPVQPSALGGAVLGGGLLLLLVGTVGAELFLQNVSTVVVLVGLVWLLFGSAHLRELAFPLGFLLFYVPLPALVLNQVALPLQLFAARCAVATLNLFEVPVLREGNIIHLTGTTLEVAEACSGIRSLQALFALSTVFAYLSQQSWPKRTILVLMSVPIAITVNALRVSGTGLIAEHFGVEAAEGFYHSFAGWLVFVVAFAVLVGTNWALNRLPQRNIDRSPPNPLRREDGP